MIEVTEDHVAGLRKAMECAEVARLGNYGERFFTREHFDAAAGQVAERNIYDALL